MKLVQWVNWNNISYRLYNEKTSTITDPKHTINETFGSNYITTSNLELLFDRYPDKIKIIASDFTDFDDFKKKYPELLI